MPCCNYDALLLNVSEFPSVFLRVFDTKLG